MVDEKELKKRSSPPQKRRGARILSTKRVKAVVGVSQATKRLSYHHPAGLPKHASKEREAGELSPLTQAVRDDTEREVYLYLADTYLPHEELVELATGGYLAEKRDLVTEAMRFRDAIAKGGWDDWELYAGLTRREHFPQEGGRENNGEIGLMVKLFVNAIDAKSPGFFNGDQHCVARRYLGRPE